MITTFGSLDITIPEDADFFLPHHFYSILKNTINSRKYYDALKKLYQTMKPENLGEVNKLYSFQDTIILCEIFEQRSVHLQKMFKFNPKEFNSASFFSGSVFRDKSNSLVALPSDVEQVKRFERTLISGFLLLLNTPLALDSQILFPKKSLIITS